MVYRYAGPSTATGGPLEIWLDGALVATLPNDNHVPLMTHVLPELRLGFRGPFGVNGQYGQFAFDELRVFDRVFTPADLCATVYHCLGINPEAEVPDPFGRPMRVTQGRPMFELF